MEWFCAWAAVVHPVERVAARLREAVGSSGTLTVLTGAGISAESGLATFRDAGGLWEKYRVEDVATPEAFARQPALVLEFYNQRRKQLLKVQPNAAHHALADLEQKLGSRFHLITQNIDDLHERGGSRAVLHMHGELLKSRCAECGATREQRSDATLSDGCTDCGGRLRPNVVWFGEVPFFLDDKIPGALSCEALVCIGTSGIVYPAAGFAAVVRGSGGYVVDVNKEESVNTEVFSDRLIGNAGEIIPHLVRSFLQGAP